MQARQSVGWFWLAIAAVLVLIPVAVIGVGCLNFGGFVLGPGRAGYAAVDGDASLTEEARTALPLIDALHRYYEEHGDFPVDFAAVAQLLPNSNVDQQRKAVDGWMYFPTTESEGFTLSRSLGWDPTLQYRSDGSAGIWIYDPGDGSDEKQIRLTP